jgi:hypothetical protein
MAIEGPLRELGIHDVFQLLDLSRKTGQLRVTSQLRDNEGTVYFTNGKVAFASIRSNPYPIGEMLVRAGKITEADLTDARATQAARGNGIRLGEILVEMGSVTPKEMERQVRLQIEAVVFELMSWREGFFSFEEGPTTDVPGDASVVVSTESLLMEGARRIDEWSRIEAKVPHLGVVPVLAPGPSQHQAQLDLRPNEWEVLTMIDGQRDLRAIAGALGGSDFDVAKIVYGLISTDVIELRNVERGPSAAAAAVADADAELARGDQALRTGKADEALSCARRLIAGDPRHVAARMLASRALAVLGRERDAVEELRRAHQADPFDPKVHVALGFAAARTGDLAGAVASWSTYLTAFPGSADESRIRAALDAAIRLHALVEEGSRG